MAKSLNVCPNDSVIPQSTEGSLIGHEYSNAVVWTRVSILLTLL